MKMYLISDNIDTLTGMRLAGVDGIVVHEREELRIVGRVGLFAGTRARNGGVRHRRTRQGSYHKFASFGHNSNLNTQ